MDPSITVSSSPVGCVAGLKTLPAGQTCQLTCATGSEYSNINSCCFWKNWCRFHSILTSKFWYTQSSDTNSATCSIGGGETTYNIVCDPNPCSFQLGIGMVGDRCMRDDDNLKTATTTSLNSGESCTVSCEEGYDTKRSEFDRNECFTHTFTTSEMWVVLTVFCSKKRF